MINMFLTKKEEQMCDGEFGETIRKSMDILVALGDIYGASKLVDITSAQVSGVSYKLLVMQAWIIFKIWPVMIKG